MKKTQFIITVLTELVPVALFVILSETVSFAVGIWSLMVTSALALGVSVYIEKRVPHFGLFAAGTIFLFGGLSTFFHNPFFIIIKDTIYYFSFAFAIAGGLLQKKYLLRFFFGDFFAMTDKGWKILSMRWLIFFLLLGVGNEVSRMMFTPADWALYKLFAVTATWIFGFYQLTLTKKERLPDSSPWGLSVKI